MEDIKARLDNSLVVFAPRLVKSEYKLMTLEGDLLKHIEAGKSLWVKAAAGSNAVVCTETKTFELQLVETSNTLLLAQLGAAGDDDDDDDLSGDESAAAGGAARVGRDIEVVGLCGSSFEAKPTPPRLGLLHSLLQRSMLTVEDANEDAAAGEDDADGGTFAPRKRGRGADFATGAPAPPAGAPVSPPKTPSSKSASAAAASAVKGADDGAAATPAGKAALAETRTLNRATHFTLRDLEACVQASRAEILVELSALGVVRRKGERGYERLISPELRAAVIGAVLDAIAENAMLGREHPTQAGKWCVSARRAARFLGRQLLDLVRQQEGEFLAAWAAAVANLTALGGPPSLKEAAKQVPGTSDSDVEGLEDEQGEYSLDGFEAKLSILEGLFVRHERAGETLLECYPEDELPLDAKERFAALFTKQTEWAKEQIQPFVDPITGPGRTLVDLLLRFTRVVNKADG
ncbi:dscc1, partial [Symbiodinium sp. KB8]